MKKYSILCFNFNDYEILREPLIYDDSCEYVYVTDNKNISSKYWKIIYTEKFKNNSSVYASFYVRYHPFEFVSCDTVFVLDGSIQIKESLSELYEKFNNTNSDFCVMLSSYYDGTYNDGINNWRGNVKKYNFDGSTIDKYISFCNYYKILNEKGIVEAGFRILKNTSIVNDLNDEVWETCKFLSGKDDIFRIDQYVFSVIFYRNYLNKLNILKTGRQIIQSKWLQYYKHKTEIPIIEKNCKNEMWFNNKLVKDDIMP